MKKLFFILFLFATTQFALYAQTQDLSDEGYRYWCRAMALMEDIKEDSDYSLILNEFLKVIETDSTDADVYYNMGIIYVKIGELNKDISCFNNAKTCYEKSFVLDPSDKRKIIKELARLEIKMERMITANIKFACGIQILREDQYDKKVTWGKATCPDGWRLPTREELKCMCKEQQKIGNFKENAFSNYFTSEFDKEGNIYIRSFDDCKESRENVSREEGWIRCVKDLDSN
jgi:tetratricopeptide (TPR) repeat protein